MSELDAARVLDKVNLDLIGEAKARVCLTRDGYEAMTHEERVNEGLAVLLAGWAEWDGLRLMRIFSLALEDANFHTEAAKVDQWITDLEKD